MTTTSDNTMPQAGGAGAALRVRPAPLPLKERLRAFNPLAQLFSPVFERDIAIVGRRTATYWSRGGYTAALLLVTGLIFWAFWASAGQAGASRGVERIQRLQDLAPGLAMGIAWVQFCCLCGIAPTTSASALCDEKRNRTLAVLASTPLSSAEIVFGLLASRAAQMVLLSLLAVPLLLAVRAFGGLEASGVLATTSVTLSTAVMLIALTILGSTFASKATGASGFAFVVALGLATLPGLTVALLRVQLGLAVPGWMDATTVALSPPALLAAITIPGALRAAGGNALWLAMAGSGAYLLIATLACLLACVLLRRVMVRSASAEAVASPSLGRAQRRARKKAAAEAKRRAAAGEGAAGGGAASAESGAAGATAERARLSRVVGDAPVLWREWRQPTMKRPALAIVFVVVAVVAVSLVFAFNRVSDWPEILVPMCVMAFFGFVFHAVSVPAAVITDEIQARTWGVLVCTGLTGREILLGKAVGALRRMAMVPGFIGALLVCMIIAGAFNPLGLLHVMLVFGGTAALLAGWGTFLSLTCRKTSAASTLGFLLVLGLWLGVPMVWVVVNLLLYSGGAPSRWMETILDGIALVNPFVLMASAVEGGGASAGIARLTYSINRGTYGPWAFTLITLVYAAASAGFGYVPLLLGQRLFSRSVSRGV